MFFQTQLLELFILFSSPPWLRSFKLYQFHGLIPPIRFKNIVVKFEKNDLIFFRILEQFFNLIGRTGTIRKLSTSPGAEKSQKLEKLTLKN